MSKENVMKFLTVLILLFVSGLQAQTGGPQCAEGELSGEAKQDQPFSRELGEGIQFSVDPVRLKEDRRWAWFRLRVIGKDQDVFLFHLSDTNWLLATDFWSAFVGGPNWDLRDALQYRRRYFVFPVSSKDKETLSATAEALHSAKTVDEVEKGVNSLKQISLGVIQFEITDYGLGEGDIPMSVDWIKFTLKVTLPPEFLDSRLGPLLVTNVECPAIPDEVIENIRLPERRKYLLPITSTEESN
jgi:hypothetical protein